MPPLWIRALMMIAFLAIMLLISAAVSFGLHMLPPAAIQALGVFFLSFPVGFLLGQRHGIQR